jgi:hypothetical protein
MNDEIFNLKTFDVNDITEDQVKTLKGCLRVYMNSPRGFVLLDYIEHLESQNRELKEFVATIDKEIA